MKAEKRRMVNNRLIVPETPVIPYIEGDGTGPDIWKASVRVFDAAVSKAFDGKRRVEWKEVLAGEKAWKVTGTWLPEETLSCFREYLVGIKGPLTTPVGEGIRSLNVALRQELDLYTCYRPVRYFDGVPSPVKNPGLVDMHIFRENTEDIYAGIEFMYGLPETEKVKNFLISEMGVRSIRFPATSSIGIKPVSVEGTERLVRQAIKFAVDGKLPSVTLVHKGNIMKYTEGAFMRWGYALAEREFGDSVFTMLQYRKIAREQDEQTANETLQKAVASGRVIIKDVIADAFLQQILTRRAEFYI